MQLNLVDNTEHRKTVTQFISEKLLNIFEYALGVINDVTDNSEKYSNTEYRNAILLADLTVLSRCLQFDFIGCKGEEGSDEMWVLQIPSLWESLVCDSNRIAKFFQMYRSE